VYPQLPVFEFITRNRNGNNKKKEKKEEFGV
jgi:hypothetical protein